MAKFSILALTLVLAFVPSLVDAADDMATLRDNIVNQLTANYPAIPPAEIVATLKPDGSFSDLDYTPDPLTNQPFKHIGRLHDMTVAWGCKTDSSYQSPKLKSDIILAYNFWVSHDIQHRNWWFNEIGVPDSLSETMLILQQHNTLPADNFRKAISIIDRALPRQNNLSAANLVWTAYASRNEGVLTYFDSDSSESQKTAATALVRQSFNRIGSTIKFTNSDGVNVDYSFHAHGPMPYNGGYGSVWINDTARIAASAAGTDYGLTTDQIKLMIDYVLNGSQFMIRGVSYDVAVTGRDWSRANHIGTALDLFTAVDHLMAVEPSYRTVELKLLKSRLAIARETKSADPANTAVGNRAFYTADYMAQQRGDYLISVKTVSKRTSLPEAMNGENSKGGQAYDGLNLIFRSGNEYNEIEPLWDWYRLPGTTSQRAADGIGGSYDIKPLIGKRGTMGVAGGASDGSIGNQAFQLNQYNVSANKSWFLFDRGEVAMGNSIMQVKPESGSTIVGTNINQTLLNSDIIYSTTAGKSTKLGNGQSVTPKSLRWVNHDSVGYFFPQPVDNATVRNVPRTGAWTDINLGGYSSEKFTKALFDLDLNHGNAPTNASYIYVVIPGIAVDQMESFYAAMPFAILCNDATVQGVTDLAMGVTQANFYDAGDVKLKNGDELTLLNSKQPASVIMRLENGKVTICIASPAHWAGTFSLALTGHYTGKNSSWDAPGNRTTFNLAVPAGPKAGSTVTQIFAAAP